LPFFLFPTRRSTSLLPEGQATTFAGTSALAGCPRGRLRSGGGGRRGRERRGAVQQLVGVEGAQHALHVAAGLGDGDLLGPGIERQLRAVAPPLRDGPGAGVVAAHRIDQLPVEALDET